MKLTMREASGINEARVLVEYAAIDYEVESILRALNSIGRELLGRDGKRIVRIPFADVLYCESVDGNAFIYLTERVIESPLRLIEIEDRVRNTSFARVSRSLIVNLDHVESLRPFVGARLQLRMDNGEQLIASRQYSRVIKGMLGIK